MSGGIFLIQDGGDLVEMREQPYDTEDVLQELLARYPNLLAGDQVDGAAPRRWLLVSREMGVPAEDEGAGRWSLDHLFLDQDAVPTLVEVKRSSDTRIRREVVGQMLDYAANAVVYWPAEAVRARFEEGCRQRGADPAGEVEAVLRPGVGVEEFWQRVKTNLQAGRVRMVFVADLIPPELRRVVEFLNGQMDPAEVLAVEVKQFVGPGLRTLVPRVVGQTAEAGIKKGGPAPAERQWDEAKFFGVLEARRDGFSAEIARKVLAWVKERGLTLRWGVGGFFVQLRHQGVERIPVVIRAGTANAYAEVEFARLKDSPPFQDVPQRQALLARLRQIPGVAISDDSIDKYPGIRFAILAQGDALKQFLDCLDWVVTEIRRS